MGETLDIDLLRTFAVIAEVGTLSRAATRIGRSQAAISLQVQRLERLVGHLLLEGGVLLDQGNGGLEHGNLRRTHGERAGPSR